jgi:hypothetical protein
VSIYAAGAVPGEFVPGVQAAFLTSAAFAAVALVVATFVLRPERPRATVDDELVEAVVAEAA